MITWPTTGPTACTYYGQQPTLRDRSSWVRLRVTDSDGAEGYHLICRPCARGDGDLRRLLGVERAS